MPFDVECLDCRAVLSSHATADEADAACRKHQDETTKRLRYPSGHYAKHAQTCHHVHYGYTPEAA